MKNTITLLLMLTGLTLQGCRSNDSGSTFNGAWADHAKLAWNNLAGALRSSGEPVRDCSGLTTVFLKEYNGTLGGGNDRFPYYVRAADGQKVGGYYTGGRYSKGRAYMVREPSGYWNRNIATHEVGHGVEAHARAQGGHPDYMKRGGVPHWPYWRGGGGAAAFSVAASDGTNEICVVFVEELTEQTQPLTEESFSAYQQTALEMLREATQ